MNIYLETDKQLDSLLQEYNCSNLEDLSNVYHKLTGSEIIDHRENSEYTNVNAQMDPDFWEEESITR